MAPPKPLDGAGGADVLPAFRGDDAQSIIAALMAETERLTSTTARLIAATPNYLKSLERVQECPKLVS